VSEKKTCERGKITERSKSRETEVGQKKSTKARHHQKKGGKQKGRQWTKKVHTALSLESLLVPGRRGGQMKRMSRRPEGHSQQEHSKRKRPKQ